jgi:membrane glycosyltransferase
MSGIPKLLVDSAIQESWNAGPPVGGWRTPLRWQHLRRLIFAALVLVTTLIGIMTMHHILAANGMTPLEDAILALFSITFAWISIAFWTALAGFLLELLKLEPLSLRRRSQLTLGDEPITTRTAIIMPIYNENTSRVRAGLEATYSSLAATGEAGKFDVYLLSDTTQTHLLPAEEAVCTALRTKAKASGTRVFYRRRATNERRKAGNIEDFCRRWGSYYDFMIVLDADSVLTGTALLTLVRAMQQNPQAGIIQTVPLPIRQSTAFGRSLQFAAALYSPMLASGLSFWQMNAANYWGHNGIIRVRAFTDHCGLPVLPGKPPLGGEILSHDFVEAALMRRAGWHVYLSPEIPGSYEEVPGNILDYAKRDRRWGQGNLQHLRLVAASGLDGVSRLNLALGAMAYLSSLAWLLMLGLSTMDAVMRALTANRFFNPGYQLFPDWPVMRTAQIESLLWIAIGMLLLPKLLGVVSCLLQRERREAFGGFGRLVIGALFEAVFAALIAPLMMTYHSYFVASALCGHEVVWNPPDRSGRRIGMRETLRCTVAAMIGGMLWGAATIVLAPQFFWWLTPVLTGLALAGPVVWWSSSPAVGQLLGRLGLLLTPWETAPPALLRTLETSLSKVQSRESRDNPVGPLVPPVRYRKMPTQCLTARPRTHDGQVDARETRRRKRALQASA